MSPMRFSIRDILWLTVVVALSVMWWLDHRALTQPKENPFLIGRVSDSFWETQSPADDAAEFIIHCSEFHAGTAVLLPESKRHVENVGLRCEHVDLPIVIERSPHDINIDEFRRQTIVKYLNRMGAEQADRRVAVRGAQP